MRIHYKLFKITNFPAGFVVMVIVVVAGSDKMQQPTPKFKPMPPESLVWYSTNWAIWSLEIKHGWHFHLSVSGATGTGLQEWKKTKTLDQTRIWTQAAWIFSHVLHWRCYLILIDWNWPTPPNTDKLLILICTANSK